MSAETREGADHRDDPDRHAARERGIDGPEDPTIQESVPDDVTLTTSLADRIAELEQRLAAQNKRLIEQDHRPLALFRDIRNSKRGSDERWAAGVALFMRLFVATPAVAATAGVVAIAGVVLAHQANQKLEAQNELIKAQNEFFRTQIQQQAVQDYRARRAQLIATLYDTRECWPGEEPTKGRTSCVASSIEARAAAAVGLAQIEAEVRAEPDRWPGIRISKQTPLVDVDLRGAQIQEGDLSESDLHGSDFRGADLEFADLSNANLNNVDFHGTNLRNADLSGSAVIRTDMSQAVLFGTILTGAKLVGSTLKDANLKHAQLIAAKIEGVDLRGADLRWAHVKGADLRGADLRGADLREADLREADLRGADVSEAKLEGAKLAGAKLDGIKGLADD